MSAPKSLPPSYEDAFLQLKEIIWDPSLPGPLKGKALATVALTFAGGGRAVYELILLPIVEGKITKANAPAEANRLLREILAFEGKYDELLRRIEEQEAKHRQGGAGPPNGSSGRPPGA